MTEREVDYLVGELRAVTKMFKAERARTAKLARYYHEAIPALDATGTSVSLVEDMRKAIAEYEASRE